MVHRSGVPFLCSTVLAAVIAQGGLAAAQEYRFVPPTQIDLNRLYKVNRLTGEMGACQYAIREGTVGVTVCYAAGEGGGPQAIPGDYDIVPSRHEAEAGIYRVNNRTGDVSVCYVLAERVVCTPPAR